MPEPLSQASLMQPDWSSFPPPEDDGLAAHLAGMRMPHVSLPSTAGGEIDLGALRGTSVLYFYPRTGRPDEPLPEGWDGIPGARGCTPQSCAFRDHFAQLKALGVDTLFGISAQDTGYQSEAAQRLHLPYPLLSDAQGRLAKALDLPVMTAGGMVLIKRLTLILRGGVVATVFYPIFPPDRNAGDVVAALQQTPGGLARSISAL